MRDFVLPLHPEGLLEDNLSDHYQVEKENAPPFASLSEKQQISFLADVAKRLDLSPAHICEQKNFDTLYFCVSQYAKLEAATRDMLCELMPEQAVKLLTLLSGERRRGNEAALHRNGLKMYSFLLCWLITSGEKECKQQETAANSQTRGKQTKAKPAGEGLWDAAARERCLSGLVQILESDVKSLWDSEPEEDWLQLFAKAASAILENPTNVKTSTVRAGVWRLMGLLANRFAYTQGVGSVILGLVAKLEHLVTPMAELVSVIVNDFQHSALIPELFNQVVDLGGGDMNTNADAARNMAALVSDISDLLPHHVQPNIRVLLPLLDAEPYALRNGVVLAIGRVLRHQITSNPKRASDQGSTGEEDDDDEFNEQELWSVMEKRFHDVSSYTRSKLIQSWIHLCENKAIPLERYAGLVCHVLERLKDKAVQVRKNAVRLLTALLQHNPFSPTLKLSTFLNKLSRDKREAYEKIIQSAESGSNAEKEETKTGETSEDEVSETSESAAHADAKSPIERAIDFIINLKKCVPIIAELLLSPNSSEAVESMHFFVCAQQFSIDDAQIGVRRMIEMVWSKEASVKQALYDSFQQLYLTAPDSASKGKRDVTGLYVACKLISLTLSATIAELASLEQLLKEMDQQKLIPPSVVSTLIGIFDLKVPQSSQAESRGAIIVLGMLASASPDIVRKHFDVIVRVGLGPRAKNDMLLAQYSCIALQRIHTTKSLNPANSTEVAPTAAGEKGRARKAKASDRKEPISKTEEVFERLPLEHILFTRLYELLLITPRDIGNWFGYAEQAIGTIYTLAQAPDVLCERVIRDLAALAFGKAQEQADASAKQALCEAGPLSQLLFILGHVALKQLIHLEFMQQESQKRRQEATEKSSGKKQAQKEAVELEVGVGMAADDEREAEYMHHIIEHELVTSNLLGDFVPLIHHICSHDSSAGLVKQCAILALCKYMCVSSSFCERNLQLLFSLLARPKDEAANAGYAQQLRANIIVAIGDLAFRFPNLLEPWTEHIYRPLSDSSLVVKRNAVMVLTHLILNDMVKVKAHISELALCVHDEDPVVARMARLFFHELAQKGAAIYNIIPDVVSRLSVAEDVSSDMFRRVMKHLLSLIEKEKQSESLMEKLCHRLRTAKEGEQEDIAYCLTLLNYSEKAMRRLIDLEKCYAATLVNPDILNHFYAVANKGRRLAKAEQKATADELEKKLDELSAKLAGSQEITPPSKPDDEPPPIKKEKGEKGSVRSSARATRALVRKTKPAPTRRQEEDDEDEDEEEDEDEDEDDEPATASKGSKRGGKPSSSKPSSSSSSSSRRRHQPLRSKRQATRQATRPSPDPSDDDDMSDPSSD